MSGFMRCLAAIVVVLVVCSQSLAISSEMKDVVISTYDKQASLSNVFEDHNPISIRSNLDFISQGWNGEGTISSPYVIENLNITTVDECISISDTSAHFIIRNCFLRSTEGYQGYALHFNNVSNGTIENCTLTSFGMWSAANSDMLTSGTGAMIENSENCTLRTSTVGANGEGLLITASSNLVIGCNIIRDNGIGVQISTTTNSIFEDNLFLNNTEGIWTSYLDSCTFRNQTINARSMGMLIRYSTNLSIYENTFQSCGIRFWGVTNTIALNHLIFGNTVNNRPLEYIYALSNAKINGEEFGQVVLADCNNITLSDVNAGNASCAIQIILSTNCVIANSTIFDNSREGIFVYESSNCIVRSSTLFNNLYGIRIEASSGITTERNMFQFNIRAISVYETDNLLIQGNEILNCSYASIKVSDYSSSVIIESNRIENSTFGIIIQYSDTGIIRENSVYDCSEVGIVLSNEAVNFRVFYNLIGWNTMNARDDEGDNVWDDGINRGNNWTDYCGTGVYSISGLYDGAVDRYPSFLYDPTRPNVTAPPCGDTNTLFLISTFTISIAVVAVVAFILWKRKQGISL
ncbi:MAG: right-handed parallel beta-helix repeat-containing protein [Candidatus Thorarchaeota archaeon]|nr:right-handed parallel beta-helix repeat-containing protein [Candidatus Thorarchaeota archaeon]